MEATGQWNMQQVYLFMFLSIFDILLWTRVRPNWQKSIWFRNIFICILSGWIGKFQFRKSIKYITNFLRIQQLKVDICSRWRWRIFHFIWHWSLWHWYLYIVLQTSTLLDILKGWHSSACQVVSMKWIGSDDGGPS